MNNLSPETTRLVMVYDKATLEEYGIIISSATVGVIVGEPGSKVRAAFTAMLASLDADYAKWSTNETYREAMMKD